MRNLCKIVDGVKLSTTRFEKESKRTWTERISDYAFWLICCSFCHRLCGLKCPSVCLTCCLSFFSVAYCFQNTTDNVYLPPCEQLRWQKCKDAGHDFAGFEFLRTGVYSMYFSCVLATQQACERDFFVCTCAHVSVLFFSYLLAHVVSRKFLPRMSWSALKNTYHGFHIYFGVWRYETAWDDGSKPGRSWLTFQITLYMCTICYIYVRPT